jgi:hypothetical protein
MIDDPSLEALFCRRDAGIEVTASSSMNPENSTFCSQFQYSYQKLRSKDYEVDNDFGWVERA